MVATGCGRRPTVTVVSIYRAIATDLDGTLLGSDGRISEIGNGLLQKFGAGHKIGIEKGHDIATTVRQPELQVSSLLELRRPTRQIAVTPMCRQLGDLRSVGVVQDVGEHGPRVGQPSDVGVGVLQDLQRLTTGGQERCPPRGSGPDARN